MTTKPDNAKRMVTAPAPGVWVDLEGKIDDVIERLKQIKRDLPVDQQETATIYITGDCDVSVHVHRLETEHEFSYRLARQQREEDYQRKQYEMLKKKFEGK